MFITRQDELINKYNFIEIALNEKFKTFIMHMMILKVSIAMPIYLV